MKTTTYTYSPVWSEKLIDSRSFHNFGHDNPPTKAIPDREMAAAQISLGGFAMAPELVQQLDYFNSLMRRFRYWIFIGGPGCI